MARRDCGLKKVGKYWHADFWVGTTHIHRSTKAMDPDLALQIAKDWHDTAVAQQQGQPFDSKILVKTLFSDWYEWAKVNRSEAHRDRVAADWNNHILPYIGDREARSLRDRDAEWLRTKFLSEPSKRGEYYGKAAHKPRTIEGANKVMRHLRLVFRWGVKWKQALARVPFSVRVETPDEKPKFFLRSEQVKPFLDAVDCGTSLHLKVAIRLMLMLGLRECEALRADWSWFDGALTQVNPFGKTRNAPPLPVSDSLRSWLLKLLPESKIVPQAGLILPATDNCPHRPHFTVKGVERGAKAVGLGGKLSPHRMRGSTATILVRGGAEAHVVQKALRHDLLETSQKYVQLDTTDLAEAYNRAFNPPQPSQHTHKFIKKFIAKIGKKGS
jgi:integrase/recombinase XerC